MLIETLDGAVTLCGLAGAKSMEAGPLNGGGQSAGPAITAVKEGAE